MNECRLNIQQRDDSSSSAESPELTAAKLAVITGALTTLANAIGTIVAYMELDALNNDYAKQDPSDIGALQKQVSSLQKEIAYLRNEVRLINNKS